MLCVSRPWETHHVFPAQIFGCHPHVLTHLLCRCDAHGFNPSGFVGFSSLPAVRQYIYVWPQDLPSFCLMRDDVFPASLSMPALIQQIRSSFGWRVYGEEGGGGNEHESVESSRRAAYTKIIISSTLSWDPTQIPSQSFRCGVESPAAQCKWAKVIACEGNCAYRTTQHFFCRLFSLPATLTESGFVSVIRSKRTQKSEGIQKLFSLKSAFCLK